MKSQVNMKTLILLFLMISCGKDSKHESIELKHLEGNLPLEIAFSSELHQANFKIQTEINHLNFENSNEIVRYYPYELGELLPNESYQFHKSYPDKFDLYLNDQGVNKLLDPNNIKFNHEILNRLQSYQSYLFLAVRDNLKGLNLIIKGSSIEITTNTIKEYLQHHRMEVTPFNITSLLEKRGDNTEKWWIKSEGNKHKLFFSSSNELKEKFLSLYEYKKNTVKRVNGVSQFLKTSKIDFMKVSAVQTFQKAVLTHFKEEYYTQIGELPFTCFFTKAHAEVTRTQKLSNEEVRELVSSHQALRTLTPGSWSFLTLGSLELKLENLDSSYFDIGLISRKCPGSRGHPIKKTRVNSERELELIVESYSRRE